MLHPSLKCIHIVQLPLVSADGVVHGVWNTSIGRNSTPSTPGTCTGCYETSETPGKACDNLLNTKYLNYGDGISASSTSGLKTGFYLELQRGSSLAVSLRLCTGNDSPERDPMVVSLEGSNLSGAALTLGSSWTLLFNGTSGFQTDPGRQTCGPMHSLNNTIYYKSYRFLVSAKRAVSTSVQYSELQLFGY